MIYLEKQLKLSLNLKIKNQQQQLQLLFNNFNLKTFKQRIKRDQLTNNQKRVELSKVMHNLLDNQKTILLEN